MRAKLPVLPSAIVLAALGLLACRRSSEPVREGGVQLGFDVRPIDAEHLASDVLARHRALSMPVIEMAARLGSFRFDAEDTIRVDDGNGPVFSDKTRSFVLWDANGSVHMQTANAGRSLELLAIDEKAYVRLDRGHLRYKSRRDVDVHEMLNSAATGLSGLLSAFGGATLGAPESGVLGDVSVWTYAIAPKERDVGEDPLSRAPPPPGALAPPLPSTWSENASHKEIAGKLAVDAATGTVLRASIESRMHVNVGSAKTLIVTLMHRHVVRNVGQVPTIATPEGAVAEYRRPVRPRDPLSFFREHLHAGEDGRLIDSPPPADDEPAPAKKPSPASARPARRDAARR